METVYLELTTRFIDECLLIKLKYKKILVLLIL